jgi:hypothetical protein
LSRKDLQELKAIHSVLVTATCSNMLNYFSFVNSDNIDAKVIDTFEMKTFFFATNNGFQAL